MASSIVLRRLGAAPSAAKLFDPARSASLLPSVSRFFNTNAHMADHSDDDRSDDVDRRFCRFVFPGFPVVPGPFSPWSLSHVRNTMDGTMVDPYLVASRGVGAGTMRDLDVKQGEDALYLRVDMPGLGKNDVELTVEQNTLVIRGEAAKESEEGEGNPRRFSKRIELPENDFQLDMIKAEMKNGVLKMTVPKMKKEDRKDVRQVRVD